MNSKQRMGAVGRGESPDRIPFLPTIFEHCAGLIEKLPSEVAVNEMQLEEAQVKAFELYGHDAVTVGIDVYNIEAEALGCKIKYHEDTSIPGVIVHPYEDEIEIKEFKFSTELGRIGKVLQAAENINKRIGTNVGVGLGISGPFSIAVELAGYESLIMACLYEKEKVHGFIQSIFEFQKNYCGEIIRRGLGISIFESWSTPPLVTPDIYREFVMPYEKELISFIKANGVAAVPLVIGGDTSAIVDDIIATGTTLLVADYKVDLRTYIEKAAKSNIVVRGNIDPKLVQRGPVEEILDKAKEMLEKAEGYGKFVLGTGVITYDTPAEHILAIKGYLEGNK